MWQILARGTSPFRTWHDRSVNHFECFKLIIYQNQFEVAVQKWKTSISCIDRLAQARLEEWLDAVVMGFIRTLYSDPAGTLAVLHSFRRRLGNHLYETYTRARIEQLFNVIIEFPDSSVRTKGEIFLTAHVWQIFPRAKNIDKHGNWHILVICNPRSKRKRGFDHAYIT